MRQIYLTFKIFEIYGRSASYEILETEEKMLQHMKKLQKRLYVLDNIVAGSVVIPFRDPDKCEL